MFISNKYRPHKWIFYGFVFAEFPFTVALLALFGIASPNTYRTALWQDGSDNGFNSNPNAALYAAANYRPYTTPKVWSQFITNYNVIIVVFSMFVLLAKGVMYILHVFPPILSALVHALFMALYAVSLAYQAGPDMSDPQHPQPGAPWYITKPCSVAHNKNNVHYCEQAKASFAASCIMFGIFFFQFVLAIYSSFPTKEQKQAYAEKREAKRARAAMLQERLPDDYEWPKTAFSIKTPVPRTPGSTVGIKSPALNPMTPRTLAFNKLGGTKDLPLRNHFSMPNAPKSPTLQMQSPEFLRASMRNPDLERGSKTVAEEAGQEAVRSASPPAMYFPPPPKTATK